MKMNMVHKNTAPHTTPKASGLRKVEEEQEETNEK